MKKVVRIIYLMAFCLMATMGMANVSNADEVQYTDNVIPVMTSNTSPSGEASGSPYIPGVISHQPFYAFNHTIDSADDTWATKLTKNCWLAYEFESKKCITKYTLSSRKPVAESIKEMPKDWTFEAWDAMLEEWIILDKQTDITNWTAGVKKEFFISNTVSYKKYRINIISNGGYPVYTAIGEMEMMETASPVKKLKIVLGLKEKLQLSVSEDLEDNTNLIWTSSDTTIATVNGNGEVKALKKGDSVITVTNEGSTYKEEYNILVVDDVEDYRLAVDLKIGKTCRLTVDDFKNTEIVTWSSMDPTVATVSDKGKVKAVSKGLTLITATDSAGKQIGQVYVRVRA